MDKKNIERKVQVSCGKCKYSWATKSKNKFVTCPNCMNKTRL